MYSRILVPLDGSDRDAAVLPHVKELARALGARVVLVRAVTPVPVALRESASPVAPELSFDTAKRRVENERQAAESALARVRSDLEAAGVSASVEVVEGEPAHAILELARSTEAALVCMGTRARGALGQLILGSVANTVVRDATVPVLLVHAA